MIVTLSLNSNGPIGKETKPKNQKLTESTEFYSIESKTLGEFYHRSIYSLVSISFVSFKNINQLNDQMLYIGNTQVQKTQITGDLKERINNIRQNAAKHAYERS